MSNKTVTKAFGAISMVLIGFAISTVLIHIEHRKATKHERAIALRKAIVHMNLIKAELATNREVLSRPRDIVPEMSVMTMKADRDEILAASPMLAAIDRIVTEGLNASTKDLNRLKTLSQDSAMYSASALSDAEAAVELLQIARTLLARIEHIECTPITKARLDLSFWQAAHRTDVLFELPVDYVITFRNHYDQMQQVNRALERLAFLTRDDGPMNEIERLVIPVPLEKYELEYWIGHLEAALAKLPSEALRNFERSTGRYIDELKKKLAAVDDQ